MKTWPVDPRCPEAPATAEDILTGDYLLHIRTGAVLEAREEHELVAVADIGGPLLQKIGLAVEGLAVPR